MKKQTHAPARLCALLLAVCLGLALFACGNSRQAGPLPGTYTGTGTGHGGPIEVQVTFDGAGRIANISVLSESETPEYAADALELLPRSIVRTQSLGADAVAGATLSSLGLTAAVADAITRAGGNPADYGFVPVAKGTWEIAFTGLPEGGFALTGEQLRGDYEITELDALSINSKGTEKTVHAKGVLLETILRAHGVSAQDFDTATAMADDGYTISIPESVLHGRDILIAFETNGEDIPPRFVVPGERAMYWVKLLSSIELVGAVPEEAVTREIDLGELIERLKNQARPYEYKEEQCLALPMALLLAEIDAGEAEFVTVKSADGLTKTEKYDTFAGQVLVIEGTPDAPLYTGPELPAGMRVKRVTGIQVGGVRVE